MGKPADEQAHPEASRLSRLRERASEIVRHAGDRVRRMSVVMRTERAARRVIAAGRRTVRAARSAIRAIRDVAELAELRQGLKAPNPAHGDERMIRRIAEAQQGGISTERAVEQFAHAHEEDGRPASRHAKESGDSYDEPIARHKARRGPRGHGRHMGSARKGS
jgi:hypothetical protein